MTGVLPLSTAWCASFQYERRTTSRYSGSTYSVQISSGSLMCASQSKTGNVLVTRCCPLVTLMGLLRGRRDTPRLPLSCLVRRKEAGQVRSVGVSASCEHARLRRDARDAERPEDGDHRSGPRSSRTSSTAVRRDLRALAPSGPL